MLAILLPYLLILSSFIGGSYLKPGSNALTREWTADRSLRRPDLGFRVVLP